MYLVLNISETAPPRAYLMASIIQNSSEIPMLSYKVLQILIMVRTYNLPLNESVKGLQPLLEVC